MFERGLGFEIKLGKIRRNEVKEKRRKVIENLKYRDSKR
jgi:hypothetical protein